jgi:hypothetical protein
MKTAIVFASIVLAACGNLPVDNRTPEQIKADGHSVKATCSTANGPGYTGRVVMLSVDSSVIKDGTVGVTQDCQITFANVIPGKAASAP